jgi:hypothetical protein
MKVWLDRDTCDSNLAACEGCFGQFLRTGVPDRGCILAHKDDGSDDVTVYMHSDGQDHMIVIPADMREIVSYEGWPQFVEFKPAFRKHETDAAVDD